MNFPPPPGGFPDMSAFMAPGAGFMGGFFPPPGGLPPLPPLPTGPGVPGVPGGMPQFGALGLPTGGCLPGFQGAQPGPPPDPKHMSSNSNAKPADNGSRPLDVGRIAKDAKDKEQAAAAVKCHLHKKPKNGCKFCAKHQELVQAAAKESEAAASKGAIAASNIRSKRKLDRAISEERDNSGGPLDLSSHKTYGFSGLLQTHVVECAHFKSLLTLETFEQVFDETYQFATSVEPYMANSGTLPSALFCCLYRFFTLGLDARHLTRLLESTESPYIRCCGFLFVRFGLPHDQLLPWLGEYIFDDEEFKPSPDSDWKTTIGEYVEGLLTQDKYYSAVLPRLPMVTKRAVEERLAPVGQYRKRTKANKRILDVFRERGLRVEASVGGEWLAGVAVEMDEDPPNRMKVRVRFDDGTEEYVHLGKVVIVDRGGRGRSRSRGRQSGSGNEPDWSRSKGKSDKELVEELRSEARERAVCTSGKDYARKPVGYKAACALPREQGQASYRLMEEETFVPMSQGRGGGRRRSPSPEQMRSNQPSAEHQARMQQLFEKYGNVRTGAQGGSRQSDEVDRPDVMRLG